MRKYEQTINLKKKEPQQRNRRCKELHGNIRTTNDQNKELSGWFQQQNERRKP